MPQERGKQQIILTGNMDDQEVRAELELNKDKPGADLKLYQNGEYQYLISFQEKFEKKTDSFLWWWFVLVF